VVGTTIAAPLFEFVFGALLLIPVVRFLLAWALLQVGYEAPSTLVSALLYLISFGAVTGFAYKVFGKRAGKVARTDLYPVIFFAVVFCFAYALCMRWPDFIDLGERLRDYSMLASSIDSPVIPKEPWMDGIKLNYYVYWYRFGNLLSTVLGMAPWEAYHALLSFSMALYAAVIFQIVRVILRGGVGVATMAGFFIPFGANVAGILCLKRSEQGFGFEPDNGWWGPSRVIKGAIDEFPAWSFVLGDAHPHFLNIAALPFFVLLLYRIVTSTQPKLFRMSQAGLFVLGAALFLKASNAWEVPMWLGTVGCIGVLAGFFFLGSNNPLKTSYLKDVATSQLVKAGLGLIVLLACLIGLVRYHNPEKPLASVVVLVIGLGFFLMSFPAALIPSGLVSRVKSVRPNVMWSAFWVVVFGTLWLSGHHIVPPEQIPPRFVRQPTQVTTTAELFMHWGIQLGFLTLGSLLLLRLSAQTVVLAGFLGLSLLYDKAALFIYCIMVFQVVRFLADKESGQDGGWGRVFEDALIVSGLVLILTPEIVFLDDSYGPEIDRMNTIFKLYTTAWGLLGIGAVSVMIRALKKYEPLVAGYGKALLPTVVLAGFFGIWLLFDKSILLINSIIFIYCIMALQVVRCVADNGGRKSGGWGRFFEDALMLSGLVLVITAELLIPYAGWDPHVRSDSAWNSFTFFMSLTAGLITGWVLLVISAVSVLVRAFKNYDARFAEYGKALTISVGSVISVGLFVGFSEFYAHTVPMRKNGIQDPTFEAKLEGLGEANRWHRGSADIIRALRQLPKGRALEAQGRAYSYTAFVSTLSSQPSYLGWTNHINLLNKVYGESSRRENVTKQFYNENDCAARKEIARKEQISYIVVGTLEEKAYPGARGQDYSCFASVIKSGDYALYQIPLS
jgi:uncharacterized membrane protein